jgi:hypothetical protein
VLSANALEDAAGWLASAAPHGFKALTDYGFGLDGNVQKPLVRAGVLDDDFCATVDSDDLRSARALKPLDVPLGPLKQTFFLDDGSRTAAWINAVKEPETVPPTAKPNAVRWLAAR